MIHHICLYQKLSSPIIQILKSFTNCDIKNQNTTVSSPVKRVSQGLESLLSSGIPNLWEWEKKEGRGGRDWRGGGEGGEEVSFFLFCFFLLHYSPCFAKQNFGLNNHNKKRKQSQTILPSLLLPNNPPSPPPSPKTSKNKSNTCKVTNLSSISISLVKKSAPMVALY